MNRLPALPKSTDSGHIYVVQRGNAYKVGFSRQSVPRRVKAAQGELLFTIPTGQRPAVLEALIHQRFACKRTSSGGTCTKADGTVKGREWFRLDADDLAWLRGLGEHLSPATV